MPTPSSMSRDVSANRLAYRGASPSFPVLAQRRDHQRHLADTLERAVRTRRHAKVAAFARLGIDRYREKRARSRLLRLGIVEEGHRLRDREIGEHVLHSRELAGELRAARIVPPELRHDIVESSRENVGELSHSIGREEPPRLLHEVLRDLTHAVERLTVRRHSHGDFYELIDVGDEPRYRGVRALHPALAASCALVGMEERDFHADIGHVADSASRGGDRAQRGERIGDPILPRFGGETDLFPEPARIADARPRASVKSSGATARNRALRPLSDGSDE